MVSRIRRLVRGRYGDYRAILYDGSTLNVNRRYKRRLDRLLADAS